jgi:hypothetical protein
VIVENDLETSNLRFSGAEVGKESVVKIPFLSKNPSKLAFGKVTSSRDEFTARMVHDPGKDGGSWSLEAKLLPTAAGHVTAKLELEMTAPEKKPIVVFASAKVEGDIRVVPDVVTIHRRPDMDVADRKVRLTANKGSFKVVDVKEKSGDIDVSLAEETPGEAYVLTVAISEQGLAKNSFHTTITVKTDSDMQPAIDIPVRVKLLPKPGAPLQKPGAPPQHK